MLVSLVVMAAMVIGIVGLAIVIVLEVVGDVCGTAVVGCCVVVTVVATAPVVITDVALVVGVGGLVVCNEIVAFCVVTAATGVAPFVNEAAVVGDGEVTSLLSEQILSESSSHVILRVPLILFLSFFFQMDLSFMQEDAALIANATVPSHCHASLLEFGSQRK